MEGMEVNLESLIAKIKKDGIEEAKAQAQEILDKAHSQAKALLDAARKEAEAVVAQAEKKAQQLTDNAEAALRQASRDLLLTLRQEITKMFEALIKEKIDGQLEAGFIKELILKFVAVWPKKDDVSFEVLLSQEDAKNLQNSLAASLKEAAEKTIEIKVSKNISKGFRIGVKGQNIYYDFSDEAILEALKVFLNPATKKLLEGDNG